MALNIQVSCANCTLTCETRHEYGGDGEGKAQLLSHISFSHYVGETQEDDVKPVIDEPVTIQDALNLIFGITLRSSEAENPEESMAARLILCQRCDKHLSELYRLFCEFEDLCQEDSYIKTHIEQPQLDVDSGPNVLTRRRLIQASCNPNVSAIDDNDNGYEDVQHGDDQLDDPSDSDNHWTDFKTDIQDEVQPDRTEADADGSTMLLETGYDSVSFSKPIRRCPRKYKSQIHNPLFDNQNILKRKRGRPRKEKSNSQEQECPLENPDVLVQKRTRGRPKKHKPEIQEFTLELPNLDVQKPKRGRPRKYSPEAKVQDLHRPLVAQKRRMGRPRKDKKEQEHFVNFEAPEIQEHLFNDELKRTRVRPGKYEGSYFASENFSEHEDEDNMSSNGDADFDPSELEHSQDGANKPHESTNSEIQKPKIGRPKGSTGRGYKPRKRKKGPAKEFKCEICGKVSKTNSNLQIHIRRVHEGYRGYQCPICEKSYSDKFYLNNHTRVAHNIGEKKMYICPEPGCGKSFRYPAGLYVHRPVHTGELKYSCEICHKKFPRSCYLKSHMSSHTSEKPFVCEHCGCTFKSRKNLRNHSVIHDERGRFQGKPAPVCSICNKSFLWYDNLRTHMRTIHEGILPYKCPLCSKAFSHSSNLKVHLGGFHKCPRDANNKIILPTTATSASSTTKETSKVQTDPVELDQVPIPDFIPELPPPTTANYANIVPGAIPFESRLVDHIPEQATNYFWQL